MMGSEKHYFRLEFYLLGVIFILVTAVFGASAYLLTVEPWFAVIVLFLIFAIGLTFVLLSSYLRRLKISNYHDRLQELLEWIEADSPGDPPELTGQFRLLAEKIDDRLRSLNSKTEQLENSNEQSEKFRENIRRFCIELLKELGGTHARVENVEEAVLAYLRCYEELDDDFKSIQQNSKRMHIDLSELFALVSNVLSRRQDLISQTREVITTLEDLEEICSHTVTREERTAIDEINDLLGKSKDLHELNKNLHLETKRGETSVGVKELVSQLNNELSELPAAVEKIKLMISEHEEELSERRRQLEEKIEDLEIKIDANCSNTAEETTDKLNKIVEKLESAAGRQREEFQQMGATMQNASSLTTDFTGEFCQLDAVLENLAAELKEQIKEIGSG